MTHLPSIQIHISIHLSTLLTDTTGDGPPTLPSDTTCDAYIYYTHYNKMFLIIYNLCPPTLPYTQPFVPTTPPLTKQFPHSNRNVLLIFSPPTQCDNDYPAIHLHMYSKKCSSPHIWGTRSVKFYLVHSNQYW